MTRRVRGLELTERNVIARSEKRQTKGDAGVMVTHLYMQRARHDVTDQNEAEDLLPIADMNQESSVPRPKERDESNLEPKGPLSTSRVLAVKRAFVEEYIGVGVEIEASNRHDDVVELMLEL